MNIKTKMELIAELLEDHPHLRDNDNQLIATIWRQYYIDLDISVRDITGLMLLQDFAKGKLASTESLVRCRRKLQEARVELRGELWESRHKEQANVIEQVRTF